MLLTMKTCDSRSVSEKIMELPIKNLAFLSFLILMVYHISTMILCL